MEYGFERLDQSNYALSYANKQDIYIDIGVLCDMHVGPYFTISRWLSWHKPAVSTDIAR